jgi:predicted amidohydrolase YtcJ
VLLTNGRIYTLDDAATVADTLVVRDGRKAITRRSAQKQPGPGVAPRSSRASVKT